jgi:hypothetical protein
MTRNATLAAAALVTGRGRGSLRPLTVRLHPGRLARTLHGPGDHGYRVQVIWKVGGYVLEVVLEECTASRGHAGGAARPLPSCHGLGT